MHGHETRVTTHQLDDANACKLTKGGIPKMMAGNGFQYGLSYNGGTQQPRVFLLKMIILGCFEGATIKENTHMAIFGIYVRFLVEIPIPSYRFVGSFGIFLWLGWFICHKNP